MHLQFFKLIAVANAVMHDVIEQAAKFNVHIPPDALDTVFDTVRSDIKAGKSAGDIVRDVIAKFQ